MPHWLNIWMLDTKYPKNSLLFFLLSAKNNFEKNVKFQIFMTQTNFSNLYDFSRPGMQIIFKFHDCPIWPFHEKCKTLCMGHKWPA